MTTLPSHRRARISGRSRAPPWAVEAGAAQIAESVQLVTFIRFRRAVKSSGPTDGPRPPGRKTDFFPYGAARTPARRRRPCWPTQVSPRYGRRCAEVSEAPYGINFAQIGR